MACLTHPKLLVNITVQEFLKENHHSTLTDVTNTSASFICFFAEAFLCVLIKALSSSILFLFYFFYFFFIMQYFIVFSHVYCFTFYFL